MHVMCVVPRSAFVAKYIDCRLIYFRVIDCVHIRNHTCKLCLARELWLCYDILCHDTIENNGALMKEYVWNVSS
jgi:hypothetical protein